jgi:hypothetical protein
MRGVGASLEFIILNLLIISYAYFECEINISILD